MSLRSTVSLRSSMVGCRWVGAIHASSCQTKRSDGQTSLWQYSTLNCGAKRHLPEGAVGLGQVDQVVLACAFRGELVPQDPNDESESALLERIKAERTRRETERKANRKKKRKPEKAQQLRMF